MAVSKIINASSGIDFDPFIETATDIVDDVAVEAGSNYDSVKLELIERWLSAHFVAIYESQPDRYEIGPAEQETMTNIGRGLDLTKWGQMAQVLDNRGYLSTLSKKRKTASVVWLGETTPERSDINDADA